MAKKVYLHLGTPKSGTTYLQGLMAANREELKGAGVLYASGEYPQDRLWATKVIRERELLTLSPVQAGAWDRILEQVHAWDEVAVISHEFFGAATVKQALRVHKELAPAEVHLVVTARDYVRQAAAVWQERLKYGYATPLTEFSLAANGTAVWSWQTQDIVAILRRWSHDVPPERVHVVTVPPPGGRPGLLWERFAQVLDIDPAVTTHELPHVNQSLGLVEAELLHRVATKLDPHFDDSRERAIWIRDLLANRILAQGSKERFAVSPEQAAELTGRGRRAVQHIRRAGYDVVGDLEDLIPREDVSTYRLPEDVPPEELLDSAVDAIARLVLANRDRAVRRSMPRRTTPSQRAVRVLRGVAREARRRLRHGSRVPVAGPEGEDQA